MRLLVMSDLHLNHRPAWDLPKKAPPFDAAVFAGDVDASPAETVTRLADAPLLRDKAVLVVPGNHEFYGGHIENDLEEGRRAAGARGVHFLDRDSVTIEGVRFVGAILWSDYGVFGDAKRGAHAGIALNDHRLITTGSERTRFTPAHALARHRADRAFLERELAKAHSGPTVVITHHGPHPKSIHPRYAEDPVSAAFVSDLTEVIEKFSPTLWIHGHVHDGFDYTVGATRVVCNPKGYGPRFPGGSAENSRFDERLVIEVGP